MTENQPENDETKEIILNMGAMLYVKRVFG